MIFFFENGRLGNQLFQYHGLRYFFQKDKILFFGCSELKAHFSPLNAVFIPDTLLARITKIIAIWLVKFRILTCILESDESSSQASSILIVRRGLFSQIRVVSGNVYFQNSNVAARLQVNTYLKPSLTEKALSFLSHKGLSITSDFLVFVHIRRGDYLFFPDKKFPAVLPLKWYQSAMAYVQDRVPKPVFVLMGDDPFYIRDVFVESENLVISDNTLGVDMAIMSLCHSGILSSSSFAWWGAYICKSNSANDPLFIAPKYWCGYRAGKWFPPKFESEWITYLK